MRPGCSMRDSTPPRDSARVKTRVRATTSRAACSPAARVKETMPPKSRIWRAASSWPGWSGRPGHRTRSTAGCSARTAATAAAFSQWRSMRTPSVLRPRRTRKQSSGPGTAPTAFWRKRSRSATASSLVPAKPPTTSEWPPRYLVVEWTTTWAPRARGFCRYGVAKVLSTTQRASRSAAKAAVSSMSTSDSSGLDGVSTQTIFVWGVHASAMAAGSDRSAVVKFSPAWAWTRAARR